MKPDAADVLSQPDRLADPACYPHHVGTVEIVQTHISVVCLAGELVYKLKKHVRLPFLDFSTLALRRRFCREEVRLNRRLCDDVYLGTAALRRVAGGLRFADVGDDEGACDLDTAVVMRRLPHARMLDHLLAAHAVSPREIAALAERIAAFHRTADRGPAVRAAGSPERLAALAAANFDELAALGANGLDAGLLATLAARSRADFAALLPSLQERAARGLVVDGHGDLHARNICMTAPPTIYDCIEFEPAFRCGDVATELAFLVMDLRYRGAPDLARVLVATYVAATNDAELPRHLPALVAYRAMVRAKVAALAAAEAEVPAADRAGALRSARAHVALAAATAIDADGPRWLALTGPPGGGKSTLAAALQDGTGWPAVATDRVRKELAGLAPTEHARAEHYTPAFTTRTYAELLDRASAATRGGAGTVLLDANFPTPAQRAVAARAAAAAGAHITFAFVDVDAAVGRERLARRLLDPENVSDAGPEQHDALRSRYVPPDAAEGLEHLTVDGTLPAHELAATVLRSLLVHPHERA